ncbi:hypothetical protein SAMN05444171_5473 [Bradyrhizobium lablabi]|uniref:Uncharacterized protein n=2 Tax=Bradyrhizobium TaxID=374 RepID=A0ABY0PBV5_9BRAD|nr:hypothetical protein SAMN05444163_1697 [Bradyrhizobium ottawaense]SED87147.1 hypothetical protein SAMN05444171_5473 [Bradyrhizobium lablabi]SHL83086.1 hypothetical protein SAMN05444321_4255 [Bradyrhizobium lablabi]
MDLRQLQILRAGSFKNLMLMKARQREARAQLCFLKHIHERRDVGFPFSHDLDQLRTSERLAPRISEWR